MNHIEYFKLQAKNLLKDYKTRLFNPKDGFHEYNPKFFDITGIFDYLDLNDEKSDFKFTLMNAQHVIAQLAGFSKWDDLLKANPSELELAHLLYDNAHKISLDEWDMYISDAERMNHTKFNTETKLEIFKQVFLSSDRHRSDFVPYRIDLEQKWNTKPADIIEDNPLNYEDMYMELDEQERMAAIKDHQENGLGFPLEETVECLHCGERYKFKYVKAIRTKPQFRSDDDFDQIVCKNYPECNGSIIDLFPIKHKMKN
ncbi:MAG: hypothetical protein IKN99_07775 [Bacteroidales bacterium]|nr:hypothetical protein [Bacteroidales bacterium]MBR3573135.1 hypothetical protein [Bacteroidales bacterium]